MSCEAILIFNKDIKEDFERRQKEPVTYGQKIDICLLKLLNGLKMNDG